VQVGFAQKHELGILFGFGTGFFAKDNYLANKVSNNRVAGISYVLNNKNNRMAFNPSLVINDDKYYVKLPFNSFCGVMQNKLGLNLDVLMKIHKKLFIRAGINFNKVVNSEIERVYNQTEIKYPFLSTSSSTFKYSDNNLYHGYSYNPYQMGMRGGICLPFFF
jgi:hypothetical protein